MVIIIPALLNSTENCLIIKVVQLFEKSYSPGAYLANIYLFGRLVAPKSQGSIKTKPYIWLTIHAGQPKIL